MGPVTIRWGRTAGILLGAAIFVAAAPWFADHSVLPGVGGGTACAGESGSIAPKPARGKGDKCVADTDFMRRNHMNMLLHQRDGTVHEGLRTKRFSLKECITCHAVKGDDGQPVKISDPKHFCRTCHDFVAVHIDCFECHASRPDPKAKKSAGRQGLPRRLADRAHDVALLADYLRRLRR